MRWFRSQAGMSLVEAIVATAIIAVALTPLLAVYMTSQKSIRGAGEQVEAMALARSTLDEYLRKPFADVVSTSTWQVHSLNSAYEYSVAVTNDTSYMKSVVITVRWRVKGEWQTLNLGSSVVRRS